MNRKTQLISMLMKFQPLTFENDVFYIKPELSKKLHSLFFIQEDLRIVSKAVEKFQLLISNAESSGELDVDLLELIGHGMITTYGRCFTESSGYRWLKKSIFDGHNDLSEIHSEVMDLRNKSVAHREDTYRLEAVVGWVIPRNNPGANSFRLEFRRTGVKPGDLGKYRKLFDFVSAYVLHAIALEREKMIVRIQKLSAKERQQYRLDIYLDKLHKTDGE
ncbi:hypothetical protein [Dyadobacter sp. CY323]|uniref:hypothetical protein n=1 Tax=Dyadobacter sp. CY323 TaxID=2907302 RepID=UPI001F39E10D|nr:hypothetical protein [Dyadobacter sp. CY323]MCE6992006.1 hypothetical protein [Dyadobacter sp. CY323]